MEQLKDKHIGETCYIIGKGFSILKLRKENFRPGPVIVLYTALRIIEKLNIDNPVYSLQKDKFFLYPVSGTLLLHRWESARTKVNYEPTVVFDNLKLGLSKGSAGDGFSMQSAIRLAEYMGCADIIMYGFDVHKNGNRKSFDGRSGKKSQYNAQIKGMSKFKFKIPHQYADPC